jgi:hypothetical protein
VENLRFLNFCSIDVFIYSHNRMLNSFIDFFSSNPQAIFYAAKTGRAVKTAVRQYKKNILYSGLLQSG